MNRDDDPQKMMRHAGRHKGGVALVILGGPSSARWREIAYHVNPHVYIGVNGVNSLIEDLDYWIMAENMNYSNRLASMGDERAAKFMEMFHRKGGRTNLISHWSWGLVKEKRDCISIRRTTAAADFNLRDYDDGLMAGWVFDRKEFIKARMRVGTVGAQALHLAGILGCREVHTIGFDLVFPDGPAHHAYDYPPYIPDRFRTMDNFVTYEGWPTQEIWIDSARFLKSMEPAFQRAGLEWFDYSNGLFGLMKMKCAVSQNACMKRWIRIENGRKTL